MGRSRRPAGTHCGACAQFSHGRVLTPRLGDGERPPHFGVDRRDGALHAQKSPYRRLAGRSGRARLCAADTQGDHHPRCHAGVGLRTRARVGARRCGGVGHPQCDETPLGTDTRECARRQNLRAHPKFVPLAGAEVPTRRARGRQLPELRFLASAHQRARRPLLAGAHRFASRVQQFGGYLRFGTDSDQHDRARRGDARRRFGTLRFVGHRRGDQCDHERSHGFIGGGVARDSRHRRAEHV